VPLRVSCLVAALLIVPCLAWAQRAPLPLFVADVRTGPAALGTDATTAADAGVFTNRLPAAAWSLSADVEVRVIRVRHVAMGAGVTAWMARSLALSMPATEDVVDPRMPPVFSRRLNGWSGLVSLGIGGRDTWGYVSAGAGPLRFQTVSDQQPHGATAAPVTAEIGAGLRWFRSAHFGAVIDVRAYRSPALAATANTFGRGPKVVWTFTAGLALR